MSKVGLRLHADEEHWIPLADLMTGLMFLFLLIALAYMVQVELQASKVKDVAKAYHTTRVDLSKDLEREFGKDLKKWGATLDSQRLSIAFTGPRVLFPTGSDAIPLGFKSILRDFFPRYVTVLMRPQYRDKISEVRIEGYSSTTWGQCGSADCAYLYNMALSQRRAISVLQYVVGFAPSQSAHTWLLGGRLAANGWSSGRPVTVGAKENQMESQRVEFRVLTDTDLQIDQLLNSSR